MEQKLSDLESSASKTPDHVREKLYKIAPDQVRCKLATDDDPSTSSHDIQRGRQDSTGAD